LIRGPNLAAQPFANRRPVLRAAALLALAAIAFSVANVWLYWRHFAGRGEQVTELGELAASTAEERAALAAALAVVAGFDVDWQQAQITFLNARIAERTFAWSALFDDLAEVLPRAVRIERVTPQLVAEGGSRRRGDPRSATDEVALEITGKAEQDDALLEMLDAFFAHERFRRPSLKVEARQGPAGQVGYSMSVVYMPTLPATAAGPPGEAAPGDAVPEGAVPEDAVPEGAAPEEAAPGGEAREARAGRGPEAPAGAAEVSP